MAKRLSLYFTRPHEVVVQEEPLPDLKLDEVLVQTLVSAISAGTELTVYRGLLPPDMVVDDTLSSVDDGIWPLQYGYAAVGQVAAIGTHIDPSWSGRLVFALHPHESHFVAWPEILIPVPLELSAENAAFLANMETAVNLLMDGQPMIGEKVVVFGQGVVGLLTTALLAQFPLVTLATVDAYPIRRDRSIALGAHEKFDATAPDLVDRTRSCLGIIGPNDGADLVYELSGNPESLDAAIAITGYGGRIIVGSWYGQKRAPIDLGGRFHRNRIRLISSRVSTIAPEWSGRWDKSRRFEVAWRMLEKVKPHRS